MDYRVMAPGRIGDIDVEQQFYFDQSGHFQMIRLVPKEDPVKVATCDHFLDIITKNLGKAPLKASKNISPPPQLGPEAGTIQSRLFGWNIQQQNRSYFWSFFGERKEQRPRICTLLVQPFGAGNPFKKGWTAPPLGQ